MTGNYQGRSSPVAGGGEYGGDAAVRPKPAPEEWK